MKLVDKATGEEIEAFQWRGNNLDDAIEFTGMKCRVIAFCALEVDNLSARFTAQVGYWIIKERKVGSFSLKSGLQMNNDYQKPA